MKKLIIALALVLYSTFAYADSVDVYVTTKTYGGTFAPRICLAIWITDASNKFVRSLKVCANFPNYGQYLTSWVANSGQNRTDAITSASLNNHESHKVTWDCKDANKSIMPNGRYYVNFEFTENNYAGQLTKYSFIKGPDASYQEFNETYFTGVKLNFGSSILDSFPPKIVNVCSNKDSNKVVVTFNESVNKISAETISNYTLNPVKTISTAVLGADLKTVSLTLSSPLEKLIAYTLSVKNVKDISAKSNTILATTKESFEFLSIPVTIGLVGYWGFNENVGTIINDASEKGNNGTALATTWLVAGKNRSALDFAGKASNVNVGKNTSLDIAGSISISAWVYPKTNNVATTILTSPNQYSLSIDATNKLRLDDTKTGYVVSAINVVPLNKWTHVMAVFAGINGTAMSLANARLYVNGDSVATQASGTWAPTTPINSNVTIGGANGFTGSIDEVAIYNRSLSKNEVTSLFKAPVSGSGILPISNKTFNYNNLDVNINSLGIITFNTNLLLSKNVTLNVYDVLGKNIWSYNGFSKNKIVWNNQLPNGMYFVTLKNKDISMSKIFVMIK